MAEKTEAGRRLAERIRACQKCGLCRNQRPLIGETAGMVQMMAVGLSAKLAEEGEGPLSPDTASGAVLDKIEKVCGGVKMYRTNMVKCPPLDKGGKLRYPDEAEIDACWGNLAEEIEVLKPKAVLLLGGQVRGAVEKRMGVKIEKWDRFAYHPAEIEGRLFVAVQHPSWVYVYRRRQIMEYADGIANALAGVL